MRAAPPPAVQLTLISSRAAQGLFAMLAVVSCGVGVLESASGSAHALGSTACMLMSLLFAALALAVRLELLGVITAQRLGVLTISLALLSALRQLWLESPALAVDPYAAVGTLACLPALSLLMFLCLPRRWALTAALALAASAALFPWLSTAPADPGLRVLALNLLLLQAVLAAVLFGVAVQVHRLASGGGVAGLGQRADPVQSVTQLLSHREAGLRRLLRQSEQAHRLASQRETELRTMLDAFPGVVLRIDASGVLSYCNERAAALLDLPAQTLQGRHASVLLGEPGFQRSCSRNLQIQASGLPVSFETRFQHPDGSVRELLMTQFVVAGHTPGQMASYQIGVDISERKRTEAALTQAKADAERANQAKSRFMSSMSHELRTPLNAVLGLAQMLRVQGQAAVIGPGGSEGAPGPHATQISAQQQLHLCAIADAGKDLLALVDETLDLSRIDAGDMHVVCQPVNLVELVRTALVSVAALAASQGVTLAPPPSMRELWVQADPVRLRQVLLNLLSNAIKYNRRGGGVAVRLLKRGADAQLVVQDTGLGLTPEQQAQLFQPFNRLGAERSGVPGTGIGLSIVHGLVGLMKGRIDVRSHIGVGSEFMVWLPMVAAPAETPAAPLPSDFGALDEDPAVQGSLLYVEDNEVNILVFEACLARRPGVKLHVARNGAEALALVAREAVDLVVLDLNLPDQSGLVLADALRLQEATAHAPLVLLTADATAQTAQLAQAHGIQRVWHKPFDAAKLLREVDDLLRVAEPA